jgi:hypothetical protein
MHEDAPRIPYDTCAQALADSTYSIVQLYVATINVIDAREELARYILIWALSSGRSIPKSGS